MIPENFVNAFVSLYVPEAQEDQLSKVDGSECLNLCHKEPASYQHNSICANEQGGIFVLRSFKLVCKT